MARYFINPSGASIPPIGEVDVTGVKVLQVESRGWETDEVAWDQEQTASTRYPLSDLDQIMPSYHLLMVEIFELPVAADRLAILRDLATGLSYALSQYPTLTGVLTSDERNGRMGITARADAAVDLHVKYLEEFLSFDDLDSRHFPMSALDADMLLPKSVNGSAESEPPISAFQISFITGGLILGVGIHLKCSDALGCDAFLTTWAEGSRAHANRQPFSVIPVWVRNRTPLICSGNDLVQANLEIGKRREIDVRFSHLKALTGPPRSMPVDFKSVQMPALDSRIWHFPTSSLQKLKDDATESGFISTYDAVMAIVWKAVTRTRASLLHPDQKDNATLVHAVTARTRLGDLAPEAYPGSAVMLLPVKHTIRDILEDNSLARLATSIRKSIDTVSVGYIKSLTQFVANLGERRWIQLDMESSPGMHVIGMSWQDMRAYTHHDFGFGVPKALRWADPRIQEVDGCVFVLPERDCLVGGDEGLEVCVCLNSKCAALLMKDELLLKYAEPRA